MDGLQHYANKFKLCILAAKRAKQLVGGARKKVDVRAENPLTIAIEEIKDGKVDYDTLKLESQQHEITQEELFGEMNEDNDNEFNDELDQLSSDLEDELVTEEEDEEEDAGAEGEDVEEDDEEE